PLRGYGCIGCAAASRPLQGFHPWLTTAAPPGLHRTPAAAPPPGITPSGPGVSPLANHGRPSGVTPGGPRGFLVTLHPPYQPHPFRRGPSRPTGPFRWRVPDLLEQFVDLRFGLAQLGAIERIEIVDAKVRFRHFREEFLVVRQRIVPDVLAVEQQHRLAVT